MDEMPQTQTGWKDSVYLFFSRTRVSVWVALCLALVFIGFAYYGCCVIPAGFPVGSAVILKPGESLQTVTTQLHDAQVIQSPFVFRSLVILFGGEKKVIAGDYLLDHREGMFSLAYRFSHGRFGIDLVRLTIPEGWSVKDIATYITKTMPQFNTSEFLTLATQKEGYLFPDTYFVTPSVQPAALITMMENNFAAQIKTIPDIASSQKSLHDILVMASILEGEALPKDRATVAGILWKRLSLSIPLQVDSTFKYINGKDTYTLTKKDLAIDSPYNTYKYRGLPPGPINNPGIDAIKAALHPVTSSYLYFLTDRQGNIYYAETFDQHKRNKERYL